MPRDITAPAYQTAYDSLTRALESVVAADSDLLEVLFLADRDGTVVFATDASHEGESRSDSPYFTGGRQTATVQNVYLAEDTGVPTVTVAAPLFSRDGRRLGVLAAHVGIGALEAIVDSPTGLGDTGAAYLVTASNQAISTARFGSDADPQGIASDGIDAATAGERGAGFYDNFADESVVGVYRWLPEHEVALLVEQEQSEILAPVRTLGWAIAGVGLFVVGIVAVGGNVITRRLGPSGPDLSDMVVTFRDYKTDGFYDELIQPDGAPRPGAALLTDRIESLQPGELLRHQRSAEEALMDLGITFNVYGDEAGTEKIFPFDIIPRIVEASDWDYIERGLKQRIRVLNLFIDDMYHDRRIVHAGVVPDHMISSAQNLLEPCMRLDPPHGIWCHVTGTDLVRDGDGQFYVLEDNLRCPSGVSYVLENRQILKATFPRVFDESIIRPVDDYPSRLLETLENLAPDGDDAPTVVLLTPGIHNSAYFEHAFVAQQMGAELVEGRDLVVVDGSVFMRTTQGLQRVDVIYRRIDDDFLDPLTFRADSTLGVPGLMDAYRRGKVVLANAPGTGIADDKAIYAYVPEMVKYYLGEDIILPNVTTYICWDDKQRDHVLANLDKLVVKETDGSGGYGMLIGPHASSKERSEFAERIKADPRKYIAQPTLSLSRAPVIVGDHVEGRHVDLRPYILYGREIYVLPGGLTRVALRKGSLVVNSSQGGGSKDSWVLRENPTHAEQSS